MFVDKQFGLLRIELQVGLFYPFKCEMKFLSLNDASQTQIYSKLDAVEEKMWEVLWEKK